MTNYQMARKAGLIQLNRSFSMDEYKRHIKAAGLEITDKSTTIFDTNCCEAKIEIPRGTLRINCGENGTARIDKPNGTHKWVYDKTPAQVGAVLKQIIAFYR